jgi:hypothetical protein
MHFDYINFMLKFYKKIMQLFKVLHLFENQPKEPTHNMEL